MALGEDWKDSEFDDPEQSGTVVEVVTAFLKNDGGFSRDDVSRFVDNALQIEALGIGAARDLSLDLVEQYDGMAISALAAEDQAKFEEASELKGKEQASIDGFYERTRTLLAEATVIALDSKRVMFSPETAKALVDLDHDGFMSEATGHDVKSRFGANPDFDPMAVERAAQQVRQTTTPGRLDFSREGDVISIREGSAKAKQRASQRQQEGPQGPTVVAARIHAFENPVDGKAKPDAGPELG